jgi:two-component system response regulator
VPSSPPSPNGRPILLVEDNPNDEALALRALAQAGFAHQVVVVRDGVQALEYLFGNEESKVEPASMPRVVLLDLKLPKVDGLEVLRHLRADGRTKWLPVVVFTSSDEQRDRVEAYSLLANSYVRKPVQFEEFSDTVRAVVHYWARVNQPAE